MGLNCSVNILKLYSDLTINTTVKAALHHQKKHHPKHQQEAYPMNFQCQSEEQRTLLTQANSGVIWELPISLKAYARYSKLYGGELCLCIESV